MEPDALAGGLSPGRRGVGGPGGVGPAGCWANPGLRRPQAAPRVPRADNSCPRSLSEAARLPTGRLPRTPGAGNAPQGSPTRPRRPSVAAPVTRPPLHPTRQPLGEQLHANRSSTANRGNRPHKPPDPQHPNHHNPREGPRHGTSKSPGTNTGGKSAHPSGGHRLMRPCSLATCSRLGDRAPADRPGAQRPRRVGPSESRTTTTPARLPKPRSR